MSHPYHHSSSITDAEPTTQVPETRSQYTVTSEKLYNVLLRTGLSRPEIKTLWNQINGMILNEQHTLYFSQTATEQDKIACRDKLIKDLIDEIKLWSCETCAWSEELLKEDNEVTIAIIENKIKGVVDQAIECFKLMMRVYIRRGITLLWLFQDVVSDPPKPWQNFLAVNGTPITYR